MDKIQDEIIGEFSVFDDWLDKYDYLIELSDALPPIDAAHRTDRYLINGCQPRVEVVAVQCVEACDIPAAGVSRGSGQQPVFGTSQLLIRHGLTAG